MLSSGHNCLPVVAPEAVAAGDDAGAGAVHSSGAQRGGGGLFGGRLELLGCLQGAALLASKALGGISRGRRGAESQQSALRQQRPSPLTLPLGGLTPLPPPPASTAATTLQDVAASPSRPPSKRTSPPAPAPTNAAAASAAMAGATPPAGAGGTLSLGSRLDAAGDMMDAVGALGTNTHHTCRHTFLLPMHASYCYCLGRTLAATA